MQITQASFQVLDDLLPSELHQSVLEVFDALVATVAAEFGDTVLTSDIRDFDRLRRHYPDLEVLAV
jgi:predicted nucleic acid-binding protein